MPAMQRDLDVMAPKGALFGLLAAALSFPGVLIVAALAQGFGAILGGCSWIGLSTPMDRPVWALVNQPSLHFSTLAAATGYWWASWLVPVAMALGALPFLPRARTLAAELSLLHGAWAAAVVGVAWIPLLDPVDGHIGRWLSLHHLPGELLWIAPLVAVPATFGVTIRLLSLLRMVRQHSGRGLRLATVGLHLVLPAAIWAGAVALLRGAIPVMAILAITLPVATALLVAWRGYPPGFPHRLSELHLASFGRLAAALLIVVALVWLAGRPLAGGQRAGILWAQPALSNNVRPWIDPTPILWGAQPNDRSADTGSGTSSL